MSVLKDILCVWLPGEVDSEGRPRTPAASLKPLSSGGTGRNSVPTPAASSASMGDPATLRSLDALRKRFDALLSRLSADARRDGIDHDGPMTPVLEALQLCMDTLRELTALNIQTTERHASQVLGAITGAKQGAEAAVEWARSDVARLLATEQDLTADRIAKRVVSQTEQVFARRARQFPFKVAVWLALVLVSSNAVTCWTTYSQTTDNIQSNDAVLRDAAVQAAVGQIHETEAALKIAFASEGVEGARRWLELMQWNPILGALAQCTENTSLDLMSKEGRQGCEVPLWITPPGFVQAPPPPGPHFAPLNNNQTRR